MVTDPDTLYMAFISFCEYMKDQFFTAERYNKKGDDVSIYVSVPLILENFWLYAHLERHDWDALKGSPENVAMCTVVEDAFNGQQLEGALLSLYSNKMVTIMQQRAEKVELSGSVAVEQITGMTVQ